jgi:predicted PhzF superfamily epimerase YddE/YHI9
MRNQVLTFTCSGNEVSTSVEVGQVNVPVPPTSAVAKLLGCSDAAIKSPAAIASIGSPKLLVEMASPLALYALRPPLDQIAVWGRSVGVSGIYAYSRRELNRYEGRNFNHLEEILEDAATGVAAGALCAALGVWSMRYVSRLWLLYQAISQAQTSQTLSALAP